MNKEKIIIVESPAKARTISKMVGSEYEVVATMGHIRDLPQNHLGVTIQNGHFDPQYESIKEKTEIISVLTKSLYGKKIVYLATDPDREGEAISWHVLELFKRNKLTSKRIEFHEITKSAIQKALDNPRDLNIDLVDAQQTRRILDRLVGYKLSPLLWKKVEKYLSAGRVQSATLAILVVREREIRDFKPVEFWDIMAHLALTGSRNEVIAPKLIEIPNTDKKKQLHIKTESEAKAIVNDLEQADYEVESVEKKKTRIPPPPPLTTSTLQQYASTLLKFDTKSTMLMAQKLYEGVDIGKSRVGLITYMRTDSVYLSTDATKSIGGFIKANYPPEYYSRPRVYKTKAKNAQEAHEAIRPTSVDRTPESIEQFLNRKELKLYELIWNYSVASQMTNEVLNNVTVNIKATSSNYDGKYILQDHVSEQLFDGFRKILGKKSQVDVAKNESLKSLSEGQKLELCDKRIESEQKFTMPPSRYTEASLIKHLEKVGIGRPSTYASIIISLSSRKYVTKEKGAFVPTKLGEKVTDFLTNSFPEIIGQNFTAKMEEELDRIASGSGNMQTILKDFYTTFSELLKTAMQQPPMEKETIISDIFCEKCEKPMIVKKGKYNEFLACSGFPECRNIKAIHEENDSPCPKCNIGFMKKRKGKTGKTFFACDRYPECKFILPAPPSKEPCPNCGGILCGYRAKQKFCINPSCNYGKKTATK